MPKQIEWKTCKSMFYDSKNQTERFYDDLTDQEKFQYEIHDMPERCLRSIGWEIKKTTPNEVVRQKPF